MVSADAHLARRLELAEALSRVRYVESLADLYPETPTAVIPVAGGFAVYAGPGSPISGTFGLGMTGPVTEGDLDLVESHFAAFGSTPRVAVSPLAHPSLAERLGLRCYRIIQWLNIFVLPIGAGPLAPGTGSEVTVSRVGPEERALWAQTISRGFQGTDYEVPENPSIALTVAHKPGVVPFMARLGGEPAGGAAVEIQGGVAQLFSASTRIGMRGRGVQAALLRARLATAAEAGCDLATVTTTPGSASQRNVERAGFRLAYTRAVLIRD